jgi:hypothetical protein
VRGGARRECKEKSSALLPAAEKRKLQSVRSGDATVRLNSEKLLEQNVRVVGGAISPLGVRGVLWELTRAQLAQLSSRS